MYEDNIIYELGETHPRSNCTCICFRSTWKIYFYISAEPKEEISRRRYFVFCKCGFPWEYLINRLRLSYLSFFIFFSPYFFVSFSAFRSFWFREKGACISNHISVSFGLIKQTKRRYNGCELLPLCAHQRDQALFESNNSSVWLQKRIINIGINDM